MLVQFHDVFIFPAHYWKNSVFINNFVTVNFALPMHAKTFIFTK